MDYRNVDWEKIEKMVNDMVGKVLCKEKYDYTACVKLNKVDSWYIFCGRGESGCYLLVHDGCGRVWFIIDRDNNVTDWGFASYCDRGDPP
jgi:hypothetical protein